MKTTSSLRSGTFSRLACRLSRGLPTVVILALALWRPVVSAQDAGSNPQEGEVMTRGPVHEAFAGVISYNAEPGLVVAKAPPELIEEIPPEERPEGDNVTWIPGYWAWDDERGDFLWVSGIWRDLPPGREWIAGYWARIDEGYQWTSGYWSDAGAQETTYLPAPPPTVEEGPNIAAPSEDYCWTPGNWVWRSDRYAWSPGYWEEGRQDWDWIPAHYVWTPRGHVFVDGYWDYPVSRRGVVFAPVYFNAQVYSRPGHSYSPSVVIGLGLITDHLFIRPRYDHYYFGDYYSRDYASRGYYTSYSYQSDRRGYDPIYAYQRWDHRRNRDWESRFRQGYEHRRDDEGARPPRTWADLVKWHPEGGDNAKKGRLAEVFRDYTKRQGGENRFVPVAAVDRERFGLLGQEMRKSREGRRDLEMRGGGDGDKKDRNKEPFKERTVRSPIVFKNTGDGKGGRKPPERRGGPKGGDKGRPDDGKRGDSRRPDDTAPQPDDRKADKGGPKNNPGRPDSIPPRGDDRKPDKGSAGKDSRRPDNDPRQSIPGKADKPGKDSSRKKEGNQDKKSAPSPKKPDPGPEQKAKKDGPPSPRQSAGDSKKSKSSGNRSGERPQSGKPDAPKSKPQSKNKPQPQSKPPSQPKQNQPAAPPKGNKGSGGKDHNKDKDSKGEGQKKDKK
ncbi:MAG: hypothetical protein EOP86_04785 [Verrucomicrobiaceae bacterium]|nr:MAG: hypothetical protein EOP86_04785 [Verrucomicrobiaceae bacterium]